MDVKPLKGMYGDMLGYGAEWMDSSKNGSLPLRG